MGGSDTVKYYAVQSGHTPGVYTQWSECLNQVRGFKGAKFKSFPSFEDAQLFVDGHDPSLDPNSSSYTVKYYGVRSGKVPGVYTDWASCEKQVVGVQKPKFQSFATREEAEAFVNEGCSGDSQTEDRKRSVRQEPVRKVKEVVEEEEHTPAPKKRRSVGRNIVDSVETPSQGNKKTESSGTSNGRKAKAKELNIYTDGSSMGNGMKTAAAGVGVWFGEEDERNISEPLAGPRQTNQRAELTAILRAVAAAPLHRDVALYTDSQYAINCVTVWHQKWARNNWMTTVGKPVDNQDLVEQILEWLQKRQAAGSRTRFEWVKGHTGDNDGNFQADKLAVQGAKMAALERAIRS